MKNLILLIIISISFLYAKDYVLFNSNQKELIRLKKIEALSSGSKSKFSLMSPLSIFASMQHNNTPSSDDITITTKYGISFSQDIFKFGGLYFAYAYADKSEKLNLLNLDITNDSKYLSLIQNIINIQINKLKLDQIKLNIENKDFEISQYREKYRVGEIDISMLNNSILAKNSLLLSKLQLNNKIQALKISLLKLTDIKYSQIILPKFQKIKRQKYINNSYKLLQATTSIEVANYAHLATMSNYFPKITLNATYGNQTFDDGVDDTIFSRDYEDKNYYSYGVSLSMPLDYANTFNTLQNTKVKYLTSKMQQIQIKLDLEADYKTYELNIKTFQDKISLSNQNIKMYKEIIDLTASEVTGGFKLIDDLKTMQNSQKIEKLNIEINKLNIELELAKSYYLGS